jgi:taurine dioxygenase
MNMNALIEPISESRRPGNFAPLNIKPLMPNFGARVEGLDLTAALSDELRATLRKAWLAYGVLIFTGQPKFSSEDHLRVASIFGKPDLGSRLTPKLTSQVDIIVTDADRPPITNLWHADNTTLEIPSLGTIIQIQECPEFGGNTSWASTAKAYRALSDGIKPYIEGLRAVHYWDGRGHREPVYLNKQMNMDTYVDKIRSNPPRVHPVVLTHPITGEKSLYVNELYTNYIEDLHKYESDAVLQFLFNWVRLPEFYITHNWQPNDVAVWDNFSVQHYGIADYQEYRVNQRVTFVDENTDVK